MQRRALIQAAGAATLPAVPSLPWAADPGMPAPGTNFPLVDVPLLDGSTFSASAAQGHVVVVYWWASWCPFCAIQNPHMQQLWDSQRGRGLKMLALSIDQRVEHARNYLRQRGYTFPSGFSTPEIRKALPKPGKGLPVTCVVGRDGRVLMAESGQMFPEDIEQIARFL